MLTHRELKSRALERAEVKAEYERLDAEFAALIAESRRQARKAGLKRSHITAAIAKARGRK